MDDFVVIVKTSATGLGDHEYYVLFALSSKKGFQLTVLKSFDVDAEDFIDVKANRHCQFILTSLVYPNEKMGIKHSYWTYDLLEARGAQLRSANYLDHRFPSWVFYTNKPNHRVSLPVSKAKAEEMLRERLQESANNPIPHTLDTFVVYCRSVPFVLLRAVSWIVLSRRKRNDPRNDTNYMKFITT